MAEQLVQLKSKKHPQPPAPEPAPPQDVPSSFWIYRMKLKVFMLTMANAWRTKHSWASVRRYVMALIAPESYRARHRQYMRGECNRCGHCCRLMFKCPFLHENPDGTGHCTIYMTKHAPKVCVVFPLDPWDLAEIQRSIAPNVCTFSFAEQPKTLPRTLPERLPQGLRKLLGLAGNR